MGHRPTDNEPLRRDDNEGPAPYTDPREPGFLNATLKTSWMFITVILVFLVAVVVIVWFLV